LCTQTIRACPEIIKEGDQASRGLTNTLSKSVGLSPGQVNSVRDLCRLFALHFAERIRT